MSTPPLVYQVSFVPGKVLRTTSVFYHFILSELTVIYPVIVPEKIIVGYQISFFPEQYKFLESIQIMGL